MDMPAIYSDISPVISDIREFARHLYRQNKVKYHLNSRSFCLLILLVACSVVHAQEPSSCDSPNSTMEINFCAQRTFKEQDQLLNRVYQQALKVVPNQNQQGLSGDTARDLLVQAQRKWVEFRDADCDAQERVYGMGTARTAAYFECLTDRTKQRIRELNPTEWQGG